MIVSLPLPLRVQRDISNLYYKAMTISKKTAGNDGKLIGVALVGAFLFLILGFSAGCLPFFSENMDENVVAMVNGLPITIQEIDHRFQRIAKDMENSSIEHKKESLQVKKAIVESLINRKLMIIEAKTRGFQMTAEELAAEKERISGDMTQEEFQSVLSAARTTPEGLEQLLQEDILIAKVVEDISLGLSVSEKEVDEYYSKNRSQFFQPESVRARQIVVSSEEEAQKARGRIEKGESFAEVAREISFSPDAATGGDLGFFERGQMPREIEYVAFSLQVNQLSQVVETPYGYHLVYVEEKRPARQLKLDEVRDKIIKLLLSEKQDNNYREWLTKLHHDADINYNRKYAEILPQKK